MDPLFGFIDDIAVQQQQEESNTAVGEYTISYPTDQSEHYQLQHSNAPLNNGTESCTEQYVRVVSDNSQNEKQVFVIKLENLLKDDGNPDDTTVKFEEGEAEVAQEQEENDDGEGEVEGEPESGEKKETFFSLMSQYLASPGGSNEEGDTQSEVDEGEYAPDPFLVISPEAVMAMAQSVGVDLNEDDASELGCLAINKLRNVVLVAMQFSQNENSEGINVEHFAKAEEQLGSPGIGQESIFRETAFKYAGGVSIIDDGPEIDLLASVHQQNISEMSLDESDPILNVHHLIIHDTFDDDKIQLPSFQPCDEPIAKYYNENKDTSSDEASDVDSKETDVNLSETVESVGEGEGSDKPSSDLENSDSLNLFSEMDKETSSSEDEDVALDKFIKETNINVENEELKSQSTENGNFAPPLNISVDPEWEPYLQMVIEQITENKYYPECSSDFSTNFKCILTDIQMFGIHPVFHVLCDMFRDYMRGNRLTQASIMNILSISHALVSCKSKPSSGQMTDLGCILIDILILPPPSPVHPFLTHVFMKILKYCNELLTWTCTYVTEMIKGLSDIPFDEMEEAVKSTIHGALCLANGLEELNIQVAQEFKWHLNLLDFSRNHASVIDGQSYKPSTQDSFLQEEILKFYYNFMKNYTNLVPASELSEVRDHVTTIYGEKFTSFSASTPGSPFSTLKLSSVSGISKTKSFNVKTRCVFRKIIYKDKEIIVPYRKIVK